MTWIAPERIFYLYPPVSGSNNEDNMGIKFTQSIKSAKVYVSPELVAATVREIRATMERTVPYRAISVDGGFVLPVQRYPLNRRCGLDPIEYVAA